MPRALRFLGTVVLLYTSLSCRAEGFAFEVESPRFKITIPGIPQLRMEVHPQNASQPHLRFMGSAEPYSVAVYTPTAVEGMTSPNVRSFFITADILNDYIHNDFRTGNCLEEFCRYARFVRDPYYGYFRLIFVISDSRYCDFFHIFILLNNERAGVIVEA